MCVDVDDASSTTNVPLAVIPTLHGRDFDIAVGEKNTSWLVSLTPSFLPDLNSEQLLLPSIVHHEIRRAHIFALNYK